MKMKMNIACAALLLAIASCKKSSDYQSPPPVAAKEVQLQNNATLGSILTDKNGRSLYYFANDSAAANTCTGGCEAVWPPFNTDNLSADKLGSGLDLSDFGSITTQSGKKQVTYKGRPMYYYGPETAGKTDGENIDGVWFVAKPDYTIMFTNAQLKGLDGKNYLVNSVQGIGQTLYLTDGKGLTLYVFSNDKLNSNHFTAQDLSNNNIWPIYETDKIVVPSVVDKTLFGSITVAGRTQLTYKGWPLYHFGQDASVMGSTKGSSIGLWRVLTKTQAPANP